MSLRALQRVLVVSGALGRFVSDHAWWLHRGQGATTLGTGCANPASPALKPLWGKAQMNDLCWLINRAYNVCMETMNITNHHNHTAPLFKHEQRGTLTYIKDGYTFRTVEGWFYLNGGTVIMRKIRGRNQFALCAESVVYDFKPHN